jgi:uroporphyrinogen decarboxylase
MTERERYLKTIRFEEVDHPPFWRDWIASTTLERWHKEGLPKDVSLEDYFGFERFGNVSVNLGLVPAFKVETIEETERYRIYRDSDGSIKKQFKEYSGFGMPQWIRYPLRRREDWEEYKDRLNPDSPQRYPPQEKWEEMKGLWRERDYPLGISAGSFYGWLRNWFGLENLSIMFFEEPDLIHEMMDYIADFVIKVIHRALDEVEIDVAIFWEDMCYKAGPLISPAMFKEFLVPRYKRVTSFLREHGVELCWVDSDGNIDQLIPLWIEGGVTGFYPLEVAADVDAVRLRKEYGKQIVMWGNIDKRALAKGKSEIEGELKRVLPLIEEGGYIPLVDHAIPDDVPYENYLYYLELKRKIFGISER